VSVDRWYLNGSQEMSLPRSNGRPTASFFNAASLQLRAESGKKAPAMDATSNKMRLFSGKRRIQLDGVGILDRRRQHASHPHHQVRILDR
jgi:hypothetical protein